MSAPTGATGSGYADHGHTPTDGRRTWPTTSLVVSVTVALMFVDGSLALVGSGPFFGVTPDLVTMAHDPQTSGGLLAAVPPDQVDSVEKALDRASVKCWWIGRVEADEPGVALT